MTGGINLFLIHSSMKLKEKNHTKDKKNCSGHVCATLINPCPDKCPNSCHYRSKSFVLSTKACIKSHFSFHSTDSPDPCCPLLGIPFCPKHNKRLVQA